MQIRLRRSALLAAGALTVHELRYLIFYGDGAGEALARSGHGYYFLVAPLVAVAIGIALLCFLLSVLKPRRGSARTSPDPPFATRWLVCSVSLLAVFTVQESLEGLAAGHTGVIEAVVASGGWVAVPLCVAIGGFVALVLLGADAVLATRIRRTLALPRPCREARRTFFQLRRHPGRLIASHLASRAPPRLPS